jgi:hypothetical protein
MVVDLLVRKRTYQHADVQRYLHFNRLGTDDFLAHNDANQIVELETWKMVYGSDEYNPY